MKTEEVVTLPETIEYIVLVKNIPQYAKFKKDRLIDIEGIELIGDNSLTARLYLRQLASMYNKHKYERLDCQHFLIQLLFGHIRKSIFNRCHII